MVDRREFIVRSKDYEDRHCVGAELAWFYATDRVKQDHRRVHIVGPHGTVFKWWPELGNNWKER
jgi:hypothetical protein